jgi:adenine phosphoribosyltransferase
VTDARLAELLRTYVRDVPDWPLPGIVFKDITPLLADPDGFATVIDALVDDTGQGIDRVVGIEARGFILAAPVAYRLGAGFVPVRKQGKLPAPTLIEAYLLEYGEAVLEIRQDTIQPGDRVLIVDDVLATGGTAAAAIQLVRRAGGVVVGMRVLIELGFLDGRSRLPDVSLRSLLTV